MRTFITLTLCLIWLVLFVLLIAEPDGRVYDDVPSWVGWAYIVLLLGLPPVILKLAKPTKL